MEMEKKYVVTEAVTTGVGQGASRIAGQTIVEEEVVLSRGAESVNALVSLNNKLSQLENAQKLADRIKVLSHLRMRYYMREKLSTNLGPTRGACRVIEYNPLTGKTRGWHECYDHLGQLNRIHPKQINGQEVLSHHYPPIKTELGL